jgi:hypothetical protein
MMGGKHLDIARVLSTFFSINLNMISHETLVRHEKPGNLPRGGLVCQQTPAPGTESRGFLNTYRTHIFKCASTVHIKVFVLNYIGKVDKKNKFP